MDFQTLYTFLLQRSDPVTDTDPGRLFRTRPCQEGLELTGSGSKPVFIPSQFRRFYTCFLIIVKKSSCSLFLCPSLNFSVFYLAWFKDMFQVTGARALNKAETYSYSWLHLHSPACTLYMYIVHIPCRKKGSQIVVL